MTEHYDLAVIGSGSGNNLVTPDFDDSRVVVIESGTFGGTCLNVGCIPTKMFVYAADVADHVRDSGRYGIDAHVDAVRWPDIRDRIFDRIDPISQSGRTYRESGPNTTALTGRARFIGDRRLEVRLVDGGVVALSAEQVVIAAGADPNVPAVVTESGVPFHTSDTIMRIDAVPPALVILGGGFIAVEMAHIFSAFGSRVTLLARGDRLVRHLDGEVAERFTDIARRQWDVRTHATVDSVERRGDTITVTLQDGRSVEGDLLLVATGRSPNTADLSCATGGVRVREDGRIEVDEHGRTSAAGVWALGDVSSPHQLKHVANAEARAIAHNLVHPDDLWTLPHDNVPAAIFTRPQIATIGVTEEECVSRGLRHVTYVQAFGDTAYGWAMEDTTGICKVIADPITGLILGAHLLGPHSSSLIQPLVQAMTLGTPAPIVAREQYWIHPALAEVVENALLGLDLA